MPAAALLNKLANKLVGPSATLPAGHEPFPSRLTVLLSLVLFLVCLVVGALAAQFPYSWMLPLTQGFMYPLVGVVLACVVVDRGCSFTLLEPQLADSDSRAVHRKLTQPNHIYRRNLTNTILLVIISLVALPILYLNDWYPDLTQDVIQSSTDTVVSYSLELDWQSTPRF